MKCQYCNKAGLKTKQQLYGHQARCKNYVQYITNYRNKILTKKYLKNNIIKLGKSCYQLELEINNAKIKTKHIITRCKALGIKTQTLKEAANNPITKQKRIETNLKNYGYKNNFQSKQTQKTIEQKYGKGITNVFQLESVKEKTKQTLIKKYGVENPVDLPSYRRNNGKKSIPHQRVENILDKYNIIYISENIEGIRFDRYNKALKKRYNPRPDIIIEQKKIIIEIYGDTFHANPKKYKPNDIIITWAGELYAKDIWKQDKIRVNHLKSFGYKVHCLWASDIQKNIGKIETKLCKLLKLNQ